MKFRLSAVAVLVSLAVCLVFSSGAAYAWEQGHAKVNVGFNALQKWDSNVFYDSSDERSDFETVLTPSITGEFGFGAEGKHKVFADYKVDLGMFGKYHDQNYGNQDVKGGIALDFADYTLDVDNRFQFTSSRAGTEFTNRVLRKIDTLNAVVGWHYNKLDFDTGYQFYIVDYLSDTLDNLYRYENSAWVTGYVEVMPKTKGLLEVYYKNIQYPDASGRNGNQIDVVAGLKGEITAKLTGIIKAGYGYKHYDAKENKDFSNPVAHVALLYAFNDRTDLLFSYNRAAYESVYANNNYYTGDHFLANINYRFGGQLQNFIAKGEAMYFHNAYPKSGVNEEVKRRDNEWAVGGGLDYIVKEWLAFGAGYRYHARESNIDRQYGQHVISAHGTLKF